MDFLDFNWLETTSQNSWLFAAGVLVAIYLVLNLARSIAKRQFKRLADKTHNDIDDFLVELVSGTRQIFFVFAAILAASYMVELPEKLSTITRSAFFLVLLYQFWIWGSKALHFLGFKLMSRDESLQGSDDAIRATMPAIEFIGKLLLFSLILLLALDNFGVDVTALVASLGVGGIAVALALQNILGDLFASLSILLDKPFKVGDFVNVGEFFGNVEKIGLKTTRLKSLSGEQLVFSNGDLLASRIRNYKQLQERRIVFSFGVLYSTPAEKLPQIKEIVRTIFEGLDKARLDRVHFKQLASFSLDYEVVYYVLESDYTLYMDVQEQINLMLFERLQKEGFEFAFPTQTVFVEGMNAASSGN